LKAIENRYVGIEKTQFLFKNAKKPFSMDFQDENPPFRQHFSIFRLIFVIFCHKMPSKGVFNQNFASLRTLREKFIVF